jgi:hypothetical protein
VEADGEYGREKGVRNHCLNKRERVEDRTWGDPVASHAGRKLC